MRRVALYARCSTREQDPTGQLEALRAYAAARGLEAREFVDHGESGAKDRRPALDALVTACRRREVDAVAVLKLDRLARSVRHLTALAAELAALGVDLIVTEQAIDTSTPAGRFLFNALAAVAELERDLIADRCRAGLQRAMRAPRPGKRRPGRPLAHGVDVGAARRLLAEGAPLADVARRLGVPRNTLRAHLERTAA